MKKLVLSLFVFAFISGAAFAVDFDPASFPPSINAGNVLIDAGIGFLHTGRTGSFSVPPLFAQVEYALPVGFPISVGGGFSFWQTRHDLWPLSGEWTISVFNFSARANWHFGLDISWLDLFTGFSFGYDVVTVGNRDGWNNAPGNRFFWNWQVGARFFIFSDNIGVIVETGYPYMLKAGLTFRL